MDISKSAWGTYLPMPADKIHEGQKQGVRYGVSNTEGSFRPALWTDVMEAPYHAVDDE